MPSRVRPGRSSWPQLKRAVGRRGPSVKLGRQDAVRLCDELLPAIPRQSVPPAGSDAPKMPRRMRDGHRTCWELGRMIGERYRSGDLGPEEALQLFDELLPQATPVSVYALTQLLTVVARAPASSSVPVRPTLAVSLFNRMARAGAKKVAPNIYTYSILIGCYCQMGCLDLSFAALGQILKKGLRVETITFTNLLRALCSEQRTRDAMDILLRRMPELGCMPNVFSYNTLLKGLCDENKVEEALELLHMMANDDGQCKCPPDVVSYNTVIDGFFKEGKADKAYNLFREMMDHGISADIVTYNSIVDGL
ncbi:hypothetical protein ACP70R_019443 [Stipagrostis hirtigluma subsp. patula]